MGSRTIVYGVVCAVGASAAAISAAAATPVVVAAGTVGWLVGAIFGGSKDDADAEEERKRQAAAEDERKQEAIRVKDRYLAGVAWLQKHVDPSIRIHNKFDYFYLCADDKWTKRQKDLIVQVYEEYLKPYLDSIV